MLRLADMQMPSHCSGRLSKSMPHPQQFGVAGGHLSLGSLLEATGRTNLAIVSFEKAFSLFQALGDRVTACGAQINIAHCLLGGAQYAEAQQRFLEALQIVENVPQTDALLYVIYQGLGRVKGFQKSYREEWTIMPKPCPSVCERLGAHHLAARYGGGLHRRRAVRKRAFRSARRPSNCSQEWLSGARSGLSLSVSLSAAQP